MKLNLEIDDFFNQLIKKATKEVTILTTTPLKTSTISSTTTTTTLGTVISTSMC
jgi:hypothetical protein